MTSPMVAGGAGFAAALSAGVASAPTAGARPRKESRAAMMTAAGKRLISEPPPQADLDRARAAAAGGLHLESQLGAGRGGGERGAESGHGFDALPRHGEEALAGLEAR